ncbi:MAG TPA: D-aminoacylase [Vicinamibacteria bacterium]|nr:D-aminoacylase [Vicinamibacteria bacterium]
MRRAWLRVGVTLLLSGVPAAAAEYDVLIRGGEVYDGSGGPPRRADLAIRGDRIAAIGTLPKAEAKLVVDATGLAVAPGFVNMLSWATDSLIADGRGMSDLKQGVTTEIFGEGWSMGPWNDEMKRLARENQGDVQYEIAWTTLREYLEFLERKGVSLNVASFVGAATVRQHVLGEKDVKPTAEQLEAMRRLVRQEMEAGALGIGSSLIYAPGIYATTEELIELCKAAAPYGGKYISHVRNEGDGIFEAVDELIRIAREANLPAEIYHLKLAGQANWAKLPELVARVEKARREGLKITADMYTYTAGATGFDACLLRWALDGGWDALWKRLEDPEARARILEGMRRPDPRWQNLCLDSGSPDRVLLVEFKTEALKPLTGKTLAEVAALRGKDAEETILELMYEDRTRIGVVFFLMSEDNVREQVQLPWVSFGSDAGALAPEGVFLKSSTHPRAYGNFARLLGRYVREEKRLSLAEAIRKLTSLPASNLGFEGRGTLRTGAFADVVVFDPATVSDHATFEAPHRYATGVRHVFVNGVGALRDGEHTGALPGRALKGPGARR